MKLSICAMIAIPAKYSLSVFKMKTLWSWGKALA
jgi:hypothetical protein